MAIDLTAILESGETIVYRTRGRSYAGATVMCATLFSAITLFWVLNDMMIGQGSMQWDEFRPFNLILGGCMAGVMLTVLMIARWGQRHHPDDLAITDRRILFANSDWDNKLESLALNEIDQVAWAMELSRRYLTVKGGGRTIKLPALRDGDAAAKAIADAAGLAAPPALGPVAVVDPADLGTVPVVFAAYLALNQVLVFSGLTADGGPLSFEIWWISLATLLLIVALALLIGLSIGGLLTVTVMRAFVSPDRMQALLCAGKANRWRLRLILKWASLLYGRTLRYVAY